MIGDQNDGASRVRSLLPTGWFEVGASPVVDAIMQSAGWAVSTAYAMLAYVRQQTRIATATGAWLDLIAFDYFGRGLLRKYQQSDASFRARIQSSLFRERATRAGMIAALEDVTGQTPFVFELNNPLDTGGYGVACGYGMAGGYGCIERPYQGMVIAQRPAIQAPGDIGGYGVPAGGYGVGAFAYTDPSQYENLVTDQDILDTINETKVFGTIVWVNIGGSRPVYTPPATGPGGELDFSDPANSDLLAVV